MCLFNASAVQAETLTGRASVIDGDTIEIHGQRIRLEGIDAPESSQLCHNANGSRWRCGQKASFWLDDMIGRRTVTCVSQSKGRYGRHISTCFMGKKDINNLMVLQGYAVAYRKYSKAYVRSEDLAKSKRSGIWSSRFVMPWDWRRGGRVNG